MLRSNNLASLLEKRSRKKKKKVWLFNVNKSSSIVCLTMSPLDVDRDVSNAYCLQRMHVENRALNQPRSKGLSSSHPKGKNPLRWGDERTWDKKKYERNGCVLFIVFSLELIKG